MWLAELKKIFYKFKLLKGTVSLNGLITKH